MINGPLIDHSTKVSTAFGILLTIAVNIRQEDLVKTAILAAVGGASSFLGTMLLKYLIGRIRRMWQK
ncbi:hypothetical protein [Chryseobacterium sp.]|uniref:hypothetical protein n=1 Tax=Chryseobacterium sp. TaxID=1871047 RepID=UPI0011C8548D|nr:hypothetical protein [Chryseobacterium sp.]TXF79616.1 hypothetical protein FUA25_04330 [Chryseobacterium sp.]